MTLSADGWISWAQRRPGIPDKVYSQQNSCEGVACHSVVGREDEFSDGIPNRFFDTSRLPNGRYTDAAAASVHFVLRENGLLIQMYPIYASTWTSGGPDANTSTISIEAEGGLAPNYGESLTAAATDSFCRLMADLRPIIGPANPGVNLFQHKDLARMYGTSPTACASDRYANAWARAVREAQEGLSVEDKARLDRLERIFAGWGFHDDDGKPLKGEDALVYIDEHQRSAYEGIRLLQIDVAKHVADKAAHR